MIKNEEGQSTIEFIISFAFAVSFILMVFNVSINYATGYIVHYANFMASRAYLTGDRHSGSEDRGYAEEIARATFNKYNLQSFGISNSSFSINAPGGDSSTAGEYLMTGGLAQFQKQADIIGRVVGNTKLDMISESFLGREPSRATCGARVCFAITGMEGQCSSGNGANLDVTLFDNGC